jgi:hypothetical protein
VPEAADDKRFQIAVVFQKFAWKPYSPARPSSMYTSTSGG